MHNNNLFNKKNRVLLYELVKTDFKLRYQGSILGIAWSVLRPLLIFAVMYVVFVKFLRFTDGTPQYPMVLLLGIALWGFFSEATTVGMNSIVARGDILRKISFPKYIIIVSAIMTSVISLTINLAVVIVIALFTGIKLSWWVLLVPLSIVQLFALAFGLSLILSTLYVKFRDIGHLWDVVLQILFYAVPIIYPLSMVSNIEFMGIHAQKILMLNPIAQIIQDIRFALISPTTVPTTWSTISNLWIALVPVILTAVVFFVGLWFFARNSKRFAEEL